MIKLATLFWLVLVTATGLAMFAVKYQVQTLDDHFADTKKAGDAQQRELRVLNAEWAYLNRPRALADMNQRFLALAPIATKQLHSGVADIAMRPPPPPPLPEPEPVVAAAPDISAASEALAGPRLPGSGLPVTPASLVKPAPEPAPPPSALSPAPPPAPAPAPAPVPAPAKSLDELIARIAAAR